MKRILLSFSFIQLTSLLFAQKIEQGFDYAFKPTDRMARYYVITEQKDSLWHREAYYLPERSMAMEGWYKDKDCKKPHGVVTWYHSNKALNSTGTYVDGKKEGIWLTFDEESNLIDSANQIGGMLNGVRLRWQPGNL